MVVTSYLDRPRVADQISCQLQGSDVRDLRYLPRGKLRLFTGSPE